MVVMSNLDKLLSNLKSSGINVPADVEKAMYKVDIEDFTEHESSGFYHDRPVVFLETPEGGIKTISAPPYDCYITTQSRTRKGSTHRNLWSKRRLYQRLDCSHH